MTCMIKVVDEEGNEREVIRAVYKRVDKIGRLSLGIDLAGSEVLIIATKPILPQDKVDYVKV